MMLFLHCISVMFNGKQRIFIELRLLPFFFHEFKVKKICRDPYRENKFLRNLCICSTAKINSRENAKVSRIFQTAKCFSSENFFH